MKNNELAELSSSVAGAIIVLSQMHYIHTKYGRVLALPANGPEIEAINALIARLESCAEIISTNIPARP